jgi:hypothetical protein
MNDEPLNDQAVYACWVSRVNVVQRKPVEVGASVDLDLKVLLEQRGNVHPWM